MGLNFDFLEKGIRKIIEPFETVVDKNFNLRLTPDTPQPKKFGGKKALQKSKDYSRIIAGLQRRILKSVVPPGRKSTIGTSPRGVQP